MKKLNITYQLKRGSEQIERHTSIDMLDRNYTDYQEGKKHKSLEYRVIDESILHCLGYMALLQGYAIVLGYEIAGVEDHE